MRFYFLEKSFGNKLLCFFILMEFMRDNNRKKVIDVFSRMFEVNYSKVKNLAYSLLKSELDAEDVAQEVFTKLWEQQSIWIDNKRELDAYILIMTKNIALNISKHQKIRLEYKERFLEESSDLTDRDLLESIYFREILQGIYLKLESIPERRRTVFELSRFYGKSHKEIADKMNISVRTVEQQICLTLIELRKVLGAFAG